MCNFFYMKKTTIFLATLLFLFSSCATTYYKNVKKSKGQSSSYLLKVYGEPSNIRKTVDGGIWTYTEYSSDYIHLGLAGFLINSFPKKKKPQTTMFYLDFNNNVIEYNTTYKKISAIKTGFASVGGFFLLLFLPNIISGQNVH